MSTKNLIITEEQAIDLFENGPEYLQPMLKTSFGEKLFVRDVTKRILSFKDACLDQEKDHTHPFYQPGGDVEIDDAAFRRLKVEADAIREGWIPDFNNGSQRKWYAWFYLDEPGFRFVVAGYTYSHSHAPGGSRLSQETEAKAIHFAKTFIEDWRLFNCPHIKMAKS